MVKVNSKWITNQHVKAKNIKLLRKKSLRSSSSQRFLKQEAKYINNKRKIIKLDFINIKNFCSLKGTIKKTKREATDWKKILTN